MTAPILAAGCRKSIFEKIDPGTDSANYMEAMGDCQLCWCGGYAIGLDVRTRCASRPPGAPCMAWGFGFLGDR